MASYTPNVSLHQWEPEDPFLRQDFNQDFQKIDAAIQAARVAPACKHGTYKGMGGTITLNIGFEPSFLVLFPASTADGAAEDIIAVMGVSGLMFQITRSSSNGLYRNCVFNDNGFLLTDNSDHGMNVSNVTYHYIAFH